MREDNGLHNETYIYTYDNAGNILTKQNCTLTAEGATPEHVYKTYDYTYSSSAWGDLLTEYEGYDITYDEIGNPINYFNGVDFAFSWTGRELTGAVKYGHTYSFTYNDAGIRTSKTKDGVTTNYYLDGSLILAEETSGNITVYVYDSEGLPLGMQYHGSSYAKNVWDVYWYEKNIFGDIVAVYNESGTKLISYTYDAYGGSRVTYSNSGGNTTARNNPFRYRGYYYDTDLALYYLNARYYDSYTGRFINADCALYHSLLGYNMFAYCYNNPVNYVDYTGESAVGAFLGGVWGVALIEPTPAGEIVAGVITVAVAIGVGVAIGYEVIEVFDLVDDASQANGKDEIVGTVPQQSIVVENNEAEDLLQSINKAKKGKSKGGTKVDPRVKSNSKKSAREKAFHKGGKTPPIHHPHGKYGPHFHPNNSKYSHWHYYYIMIFPIGYHEQEQ